MNTASDVMKNYKYSLSFENIQIDGYVTEKLASPLLGMFSLDLAWIVLNLQLTLCRFIWEAAEPRSSSTRKPSITATILKNSKNC